MPPTNWQAEGKITLGGILFDAVTLVRAAIPLMRHDKYKSEVQGYIAGGPAPSPAAMTELEESILKIAVSQKKTSRGG